MKITFPHMGHLAIPIRTLLEGIGLEVIVPPPITRRTLDLGVRYSPEFACFPLKLNVGNFIEAHEMGADTILMAGGVGPCRFGYYAEVERNILRNLGYRFEMVVLDPPRGRMRDLAKGLKKLVSGSTDFSWARLVRAMRFSWRKLVAIESLQKECFLARPGEERPGSVNKVFQKAISKISEAKTAKAVDAARKQATKEILALPKKPRGEPPLRVGIVGEIYMVLEQFANLGVEDKLGRLGVEVNRSLFLSDWVRHNVFLDVLRLRKDSIDSVKAASPYLNHFVGGEGLHSVGKTADYAKDGFDGVVHIMPFTCMPEIVAQSVLQKVSKDLDIPIIHLVLDEHTGETGLLTRLEAFVDLLERKRRLKQSANGRSRAASLGGG